jgi:hypothetical protein
MGILILLFAGLPLQAEDKPKEKPSTPADQYRTLDAEYQTAREEFDNALRKAKTAEEREKIIEQGRPQPDQFIPRFMELADKEPKDPAAVDALLWVIHHSPSVLDASLSSPQARALNALLRDHSGSEKLRGLFWSMGNSEDKAAETWLRTALERSTRREVQGEACLALAQHLRIREANKADQEIEKLYERILARYADIKQAAPGAEGTLGDVAKRALFEIRHLAISKPVPDIEGEDLDGKRFKLSDYRGKVVLLEFWGFW